MQVIFLNLILIGMEAQFSLNNNEEFAIGSWAWIAERVFLLLYCRLHNVSEGRISCAEALKRSCDTSLGSPSSMNLWTH